VLFPRKHKEIDWLRRFTDQQTDPRKEVFVIDADGNQKGIMSVLDALRLAEDEGLDLVEVSPTANPPVCRILDFGKYGMSRRNGSGTPRRTRRPSRSRNPMQPKIESMISRRKASSSLISSPREQGEDQHPLRGREMAHTDLGKDTLNKILEILPQMV
jgi:translation initiation factor IF-3